MTTPPTLPAISRIPVHLISIPSPRARNHKIFNAIVQNIQSVGLKRPITVSKRSRNGKIRYELVCGQGRLEAFQALGQKTVPALVVEARRPDCLLMSLVENCARRQHTALDLLHDISGMKGRGHSETKIAEMTGLSADYIRGVLRLMDKGETRLIAAVEHGKIPISVAVEIAEADDLGIQVALQNAYEKNLLRGRKLILARRLIEQRRRRGKKMHGRSKPPDMDARAILRAYRRDATRKRMLVLRAEATRDTLIFITCTLRELFRDENLVNLLRAEGIDTLPRSLAARIRLERSNNEA